VSRRPCKYCGVHLVYLPTIYGRQMGFYPAPRPIGEQGPGEGYVIRRRDGRAMAVADLPAHVVAGLTQVMYRHRCPRYADWKAAQDSGMGPELWAWTEKLRNGRPFPSSVDG